MPAQPPLAFFRRHAILSWTLGSIAGLFVLLNYVILPLYVNHGSRQSVPAVVGLPLDQARAVLDSASLVPVESDTRPDPDLPAGVVVSQNPAASSMVKEGRRVYLTISGGEVQVFVPLLRGRSMREARFTLERHGLRLGEVTYIPSEEFPDNTIVDQSSSADAKIPKGSRVSITVSSGSATGETTVPAVAGKSLGEADKLLQAAGLRRGQVTYQSSFDLVPNTVVDQFPRAGEPAKRGDAVDLFVVTPGRPAEEIEQAPEE
jgi:serine/threonine-protein kinase